MPAFTLRTVFVGSSLALAFEIARSMAAAQLSAGECTLEPLTLPLFDATPAAIIAATPLAVELEPDHSDDLIHMAVENIVACINTGDPAYQFAVFTPRYLAEQLADPSVTYQPEFEQRVAMGTVDTGGQFELTEVDDITALEDGYVSVAVELQARGATYRDTLVLANVDGVWLIDSVDGPDPPR